jgi:adenylate cyclase
MNYEIERRFLVDGDDWRNAATASIRIRQAYLSSRGKATVRIRVEDGRRATVAIKSRRAAMRRLEIEYPIALPEAEALMALRQGSVVEKVRHVVRYGDETWEVDEFGTENLGLIIAEIELRDERQMFDLPSWIGAEITGDERYCNSSLAQCPRCAWPRPGNARGEIHRALELV